MLSVMRRLLQDREIGRAVVRLVPVDVMNVLVGPQLPSKELLHNPAMLVNLLPVDANDTVASRVEAIDKLAPYVTFAGAERPLIGSDLASGLREFLSASATDEFNSHVVGKIPYPKEEVNTGNIYTVELLPDEADFLDWDKPLSEQSEKVKAAIEGAEWDGPKDRYENGKFIGDVENALFYAQRRGEVIKGSDLYGVIVSAMRPKAGAAVSEMRKASEKLASLGIPGIKYLDGNSRGNGKGTRNYVIFDENLVKILEENGRKVDSTRFSLSPGGMASEEGASQTPEPSPGGLSEAEGKNVFVRFGGLPKGGKSTNYVTNSLEKGVSVYRAKLENGKLKLDLTTNNEIGTLSSIINRPLFIVTGQSEGIGSDGEPILSKAKAKPFYGTLSTPLGDLTFTEGLKSKQDAESLAEQIKAKLTAADRQIVAPPTDTWGMNSFPTQVNYSPRADKAEDGQWVVKMGLRKGIVDPMTWTVELRSLDDAAAQLPALFPNPESPGAENRAQGDRFSLAPRSLASVDDTVIASKTRSPEFRDKSYTTAREKLSAFRRDGDRRVDKNGNAPRPEGAD